MKNQQILINFSVKQHKETWHQKYKCAHLTYKLLLHYHGKCKKGFFNNIQQ